MKEVILQAAQAERRAVPRSAMVACKLAFIDCKLPGSDQKENYSIIGAGVTQSKDQVVNLTEPHGFSVGAAAMPPGVTNNLHLHFTAEVFLIHSGRWRFRWGVGEQAGEIEGGPGDVLSIPTWIFRGFSNVGEDKGWIFTALGGDDTGGIIWHPDVLKAAAGYGLYLGQDNSLIEGAPGRPPEGPLVEPLSQADLDALPRYDARAMRARLQRGADLDWSSHALLGASPGCELAPVIGHGLSEDARQRAPMLDVHGFSVDWLRLGKGASTGRHLLHGKLVLLVFEGAVDIILNKPDQAVAIRVEAQGVYSLPAEVWREIRQAGDRPALLSLVASGDARKRLVWDAGALRQAEERGVTLDPGGYLSERRLLPLTAHGVGFAD
ncbi:cupin domain-containing protein [Bordetella hinzii]|uniref:cupin domain-containing protein n=1 Tax=Bordetella hinzii TaxID=103855 RepID=UPI00051994FD|nr:cupin domain-containing protein [Bordetella hinzii]